MNEKLQKVLEDVLKDEAKASEFAKLQTVDEMYAYFEKKVPGLSESEFDSFIVEMMEGYAENEEAIQNIDVNSLADVAGGASIGSKITAGALGILSLIPALGTSASATNVKKARSGKTPVSVVKKVPTPEKAQEPVITTPETPEAPAAAETPAPVVQTTETKLPEPSNKFPASKSWIRRHPIKTTIGAIGAILLTYFGAKKMGLIGNNTIPEAPKEAPHLLNEKPAETQKKIQDTQPEQSHEDSKEHPYDGEFKRAIDHFNEALANRLPDVPENSPKEELILYNNALSYSAHVKSIRSQMATVDKSQVSPDLFNRLEIELKRTEEQCDRIINATKQDVKNTGRLDFLQQLINSRERYQEAIIPYSDSKNDEILEKLEEFTKSQKTAINKIEEISSLYNLAIKRQKNKDSDFRWTQSHENRFAVIQGKLRGWNIQLQ